MASDREKLLAEVLSLPAEDRAAVAAVLLLSLEDEPDDDQESVEAAWAEEIRRRLQELGAGTAETLSAEQARELIASDAAQDR